jgi:hypothetical protein
MNFIFGAIILFLFFCGLISNKLGWTATRYVLREAWGKMVLNNNGLAELQKRYLEADEWNSDSYRQYGVLLYAKNDKVLILTVDGFKLFVPINTSQQDVFYLTLDACKNKSAIQNILRTQMSINLKESRQKNLESWVQEVQNKSLWIVNISYLAVDDEKAVKRFKYLHALNGLVYENNIKNICLY